MNIFEAYSSVNMGEFLDSLNGLSENISKASIAIQNTSKIADSALKTLSESIKTVSQTVQFFQQWDFVKVSESIIKLPDDVKKSADIWADYGWVPFLPESRITDIMHLKYPNSQEEADTIMMEKLDEEGLQKLFDRLEQKVLSHSHCITSFNDAVNSYNNGIYSGCALLLFALIDSCFVVGQPLPKKKSDKDRSERSLSLSAVGKAIDEEKSKWIVSAYAVKRIIEIRFKHGKDFNKSNEIGINRNFLAHGMNSYIPNQKDCLQLFVLLYNVYVLFDTEMFSWKSSTEISKP